MEQGVVIMTNKQNWLIEVTVNLGQMLTGHASVLQWHINYYIAQPEKKCLLLNNFNR